MRRKMAPCGHEVVPGMCQPAVCSVPQPPRQEWVGQCAPWQPGAPQGSWGELRLKQWPLDCWMSLTNVLGILGLFGRPWIDLWPFWPFWPPGATSPTRLDMLFAIPVWALKLPRGRWRWESHESPFTRKSVEFATGKASISRVWYRMSGHVRPCQASIHDSCSRLGGAIRISDWLVRTSNDWCWSTTWKDRCLWICSRLFTDTGCSAAIDGESWVHPRWCTDEFGKSKRS